MTEALDSASASAAGETYTVEYGDAILRLLQERTLATCAGFFLPHLRPGMTVLDCGCGPGTMTLEIAERVAPGQVVGIDVDAGQCAKAQALAATRGITTVRFETGDVYALPFPDATFDAVFSHALVSHLGEPGRAFAESRRVLKPNGVLAVSENDTATFVVSPAGSAMDRFMALYLRVLAHNGGNQLLTRHLRGALVEAGFTRTEAYAGAEVWGTPERVRLVAAAMAGIARGPGFVATVLSQGWADQAEVSVLPDEVVAWGDRHDAYMAVLKCGALGWVR
jgi:SAM-dependent methyltransferase